MMMKREKVETLDDSAQGLLKIMEDIPVQAYMAAAGASVVASIGLFLLNRRNASPFVAQWPITILGTMLVYRLLKPSRERPSEAVRETVEKTKDVLELSKAAVRKTSAA